MKKKILLIIIILTKISIFSSFIFSNGEWQEKAEKEEEMQRILNPQTQSQQIPLEQKETVSEKPKQNLKESPGVKFKITLRNTIIIISFLTISYLYYRMINKD